MLYPGSPLGLNVGRHERCVCYVQEERGSQSCGVRMNGAFCLCVSNLIRVLFLRHSSPLAHALSLLYSIICSSLSPNFTATQEKNTAVLRNLSCYYFRIASRGRSATHTVFSMKRRQ